MGANHRPSRTSSHFPQLPGAGATELSAASCSLRQLSLEGLLTGITTTDPVATPPPGPLCSRGLLISPSPICSLCSPAPTHCQQMWFPRASPQPTHMQISISETVSVGNLTQSKMCLRTVGYTECQFPEGSMGTRLGLRNHGNVFVYLRRARQLTSNGL